MTHKAHKASKANKAYRIHDMTEQDLSLLTSMNISFTIVTRYPNRNADIQVSTKEDFNKARQLLSTSGAKRV